MARTPVQHPAAPAAGSLLPCLSDLHAREDNMATTLGIVAEFRRECARLGAQRAAFVGDWGHFRGLVPVRLQNAIVDELDQWALEGRRLHVLPGNHDQVDVQGRHALEVFRTHPAVRLYDRPELDELGLWIPFSRDLEAVRAVLRKHAPQRVVFWHGPMLGAAMNDHRVADVGLRVEDFDGYDIAVLGHFHKRQSFGRVHYVGSPWQTRLDEAGQTKGFAVLDLAALSLAYVDRVWGPRHVRAESATLDAAVAAVSAYGPQDVVRLVVPEEEVERVSRTLAGRFADFAVTPQKTTATGHRTIGDGPKSHRDYALAYIEARRGDLDAQALIGAFDRFAAP